MFGYVNAYRDLLRVCDYNIYKGYYCGLCKKLGKKFNQITRFGLSYDMTFLAVLMSSLEDKPVELKYQNCIAHPVSKRPVIKEDRGIDYSADMSVILTYLKFKDDWNDEKSFKSMIRLFYYLPFRRIIKKHINTYNVLKQNLDTLNQLEKAHCSNIDEVAHCFGEMLMAVFDFKGDNKPLSWLGYHIGRFIYITDAYADIEKDIKNQSYNPFVEMYGVGVEKSKIEEGVKSALTLTLSEISNAYNLLDIKKNKELLYNIIYLGLRQSLEKL